MSKSKFIHTLSESENTSALEQKAIVVSFVKMLRFYWVYNNTAILLNLVGYRNDSPLGSVPRRLSGIILLDFKG